MFRLSWLGVLILVCYFSVCAVGMMCFFCDTEEGWFGRAIEFVTEDLLPGCLGNLPAEPCGSTGLRQAGPRGGIGLHQLELRLDVQPA